MRKSFSLRSAIKWLLVATPLLITAFLVVAASFAPFEANWRQDEGKFPTFRKVETGDTYLVGRDGQPGASGYYGWTAGVCDGQLWIQNDRFFDGMGGRYSDAECNEYWDSHPNFSRTFAEVRTFRVWRGGETSAGFIAPVWMSLLFAGLPLAIVMWRLRKRKSRPGLCARCYYDLRAHRQGEKCPECGTVIDTHTKVAT